MTWLRMGPEKLAGKVAVRVPSTSDTWKVVAPLTPHSLRSCRPSPSGGEGRIELTRSMRGRQECLSRRTSGGGCMDAHRNLRNLPKLFSLRAGSPHPALTSFVSALSPAGREGNGIGRFDLINVAFASRGIPSPRVRFAHVGPLPRRERGNCGSGVVSNSNILCVCELFWVSNCEEFYAGF